MLHLTAACHCLAPDGAPAQLEFEAGWCWRCGRLLDPLAEVDGAVDGWLLLEAAVERQRIELRQTAAELVDDEPAYAAWLAERLFALPRSS